MPHTVYIKSFGIESSCAVNNPKTSDLTAKKHMLRNPQDDDEEAAVDGRAAGAIRQIIFSSDISISGGQLGRSSSIT